MAASIAIDLSILAIFKYYSFFVSSLRNLPLLANVPIAHLILPIGISFYTFHTISYIVDVTAGRVRPTRNILQYLTYVGLFSQLVAGPIIRFKQIKGDLEAIDGSLEEDHVARGIGFFVVGLVKKVIIADHIGAYVDPMLASYHSLSLAGAWLAALGYAFQLYFDFSGYSDMAVGLGHLFRIQIPQNFAAPYQAAGIGDFWRRWHISLSSWLRDYLYIPLGGNRCGWWRTQANLLITMVLGGLWHGANWTFVAWGAYHGVLLILDKWFRCWLVRLPSLVYRWATFLLVLVGWVFFRSVSFSMAGTWLRKMAGFEGGTARAPLGLGLWVIAAFVAVNVLPETWGWRFTTQRRWAVAYALVFVIVYLFINQRRTVFLYYQF